MRNKLVVSIRTNLTHLYPFDFFFQIVLFKVMGSCVRVRYVSMAWLPTAA